MVISTSGAAAAAGFKTADKGFFSFPPFFLFLHLCYTTAKIRRRNAICSSSSARISMCKGKGEGEQIRDLLTTQLLCSPKSFDCRGRLSRDIKPEKKEEEEDGPFSLLCRLFKLACYTMTSLCHRTTRRCSR